MIFTYKMPTWCFFLLYVAQVALGAAYFMGGVSLLTALIPVLAYGGLAFVFGTVVLAKIIVS